MNTVCLLGRITRDLELKYSQNNMAVCKFSVAIDRRTKEKETPTLLIALHLVRQQNF